MITPEEMQAIVGPMREYIDARIAEVAMLMNDEAMRLRACEEKLQHPALVLDYRAWVIEVAVGLGVTAKELVDAKKKLREDEEGEGE